MRLQLVSCSWFFTEEMIGMARRKVELTEAQKRRNAEILARLEEERQRLVKETRELQQRTKRKPGRKRKNKATETAE
jgi:hypothetical protein